MHSESAVSGCGKTSGWSSRSSYSVDGTRDAVVLCVAKAGAEYGAGFRSLVSGVGFKGSCGFGLGKVRVE